MFEVGQQVMVKFPDPGDATLLDLAVGMFNHQGSSLATITAPFNYPSEMLWTVKFDDPIPYGHWTCRESWLSPMGGPW